MASIDEKLKILLENKPYLLLTDVQAIPQFYRVLEDGRISLNATHYFKNSCTTYFYDKYCYYADNVKMFRFGNFVNHYFSCPNDDIESIKAFLDGVVVMIDNNNKLLWYDEEFFRSRGYYLVGPLILNESEVVDLIRKAEK